MYMTYFKTVGTRGHNLVRGHNLSRFGPSCVHPVYFLRKSTEFCVMRIECQRTIIHFLPLIFHKLPVIAKRCPIPIFPLPVISISPTTPLLLPYCSPITPWQNRASGNPPIFDTLEQMEMQTIIPLSGLLKLFCQTSSLPQRLQTLTLLQRQPFLVPFLLQ